MIIKSIELQNFRNYEDLNISFDEGTNIFYGDNAQGKTNILEAAYLSGTTKSHKCSKDKEMIRFGEQESHIRTVVVKKDKEYQIDMHLKHNRSKGIAINKVPIKKASELFGILNMVFFSPEDLNIIKNGPAERRRFLDSELCQLDKIYLSDLTTYNKILNQRNKLLKDMVYRPDLKDTLPVWDMQLVETGRKIIRRRKQFVDELNEIVHDIHYRISGEKEVLIETSVKAVEKGMVIADQTATQLEDVADNSRTITEQVGNIADTLETQTTAIHQINEGIEQINDVVQTNSATSEECAAASQEMSSEAENLRELIRKLQVAKFE